MAWGSVTLRPGVDVEKTPTLNEAGYSSSSLVRFKAGLAQKIGGWVRYYANAVAGIPRGLHAWQDLNVDDHLAVGATQSLNVITNGQIAVITPQTLTSDFAPNFTTTATSTTVTVDDANITNVTTYDSVEFKTPVSVGGIILSGVYPISLVLGTTNYQIEAATEATSSVSNGGDVPVFDTTSGSPSVAVTLADHGLSVGSSVVFALSTTVGGVTIVGSYTVTEVSSADVFSISVDTTASSTTTASMNAGDAELVYYIGLGPVGGSTGYSIGTYSGGGYSTGSAVTAQTGTPITATDWTHDNWGSTLLSCPEGGGIYEWTPDAGFQNASLIPNAPLFNGGMFVAAPAQIVIAWGSAVQRDIGVLRDPLAYNWSDQADYTFWTPGVVNPATQNASQAGSNRIPTGSKIIAGMQAPQRALLWTDLDLWAIDYIGAPEQGLIFGQNKIASSCGAIGSHAVGQMGNTVFWMGQSNFFQMSSGGVSPIPCSVWDAVFQDLDLANAWKVRCCPNTPFNEVMWQYPSLSGGTGENDSYVKLNILEQGPVWDMGGIGAQKPNLMPRSAWTDQSVLGKPIGASPSGIVYQHETTENADGQPISWSFKTGYWMISEGEDVCFVDLIIPDFRYGFYNGAQSATVQITLYSVMYPGEQGTAAERTYGPYTVTSASNMVPIRLRGRQMAIQVSGSDLDSFVRLGRVRMRFAPDGRQ